MKTAVTKGNLLRGVIFSPYRKGMGPRFRLTVWDTYRTDSYGKSVLAYRLASLEPGTVRIIFEGEDFCCSPMHAIDSDECIESLMGFLTLRKGDTDAEYFDNYTPEQLEFSQQHAEALSCEVQSRFGSE